MTDTNTIDTAYQAWQADPRPETLNQVVTHLKPTIEYAVASVGAAKNPVVQAKARLVAAEAVEKFDPTNVSKASLPTFVASQLRQVSRLSRESAFPIKVPERMQMDLYRVSRERSRLTESMGREPDMLELSDALRMPMKRLQKVFKAQVAMPTESAYGEVEQEGPDHDQEALEYVMHGSDHTDRRVLELKLGLGDQPPMPPHQIAKVLNLTPTQLSRRSMRLAARINSIRESLGQI